MANIEILTVVYVINYVLYYYLVQLLTPARIVAQTSGREVITAVDIEEIDDLFKDAKASAKLLAESEGFLS